MAEVTFGGVKGRPSSIGRSRHVFGSLAARAHGWFDGVRGSSDGITHELDKLKERGEAAGRQAAAWYHEVSAALEGECQGLRFRLQESEADEHRLESEIRELAVGYEQERTSHSEHRWRERERDLGRLRRERPDLRDRLTQAESELVAAFELARTSAEEHKDYYEGLMRAYCAANRKASIKDVLPMIEIPDSLQSKPNAPTPSAVAPPLPATPDTSGDERAVSTSPPASLDADTQTPKSSVDAAAEEPTTEPA